MRQRLEFCKQFADTDYMSKEQIDCRECRGVGAFRDPGGDRVPCDACNGSCVAKCDECGKRDAVCEMNFEGDRFAMCLNCGVIAFVRYHCDESDWEEEQRRREVLKLHAGEHPVFRDHGGEA